MLKAVLKYTDCLQDGRNVFSILAAQNIRILKTRTPCLSIYPRVTILIEDYQELNKLLCTLNYSCNYEVRVVKTIELKGKKYKTC